MRRMGTWLNHQDINSQDLGVLQESTLQGGTGIHGERIRKWTLMWGHMALPPTNTTTRSLIIIEYAKPETCCAILDVV